MSFWDDLFGAKHEGIPPGYPGGPPRQLALPRLINLMINPFATRGARVGDFGKDVYEWGGVPLLSGGFVDPFPIWQGVSFSLGALKTARGHFPLPPNFYLLNFFASSSSNVNGGFKVVLYDTARRKPFTTRPVNFNTFAGTGTSPLFQREPYPFADEPDEAKLKWTVYSLESVSSNIEFGLYGVQVTKR
jgi:hypothetical protein